MTRESPKKTGGSITKKSLKPVGAQSRWGRKKRGCPNRGPVGAPSFSRLALFFLPTDEEN